MNLPACLIDSRIQRGEFSGHGLQRDRHLHFGDRSDTFEVAGKNGLRQCSDSGQGRDIPTDNALVVRLMLGKFTLAGHSFFAHSRAVAHASKSNILDACHSIRNRYRHAALAIEFPNGRLPCGLYRNIRCTG